MSQLLQLAVGVLLARLLGREAFGLLGMAMVVTGIAGVVSEAGCGSALVQRRALDPALLTTAFWAGTILGLLQFALLWAAAPAVSAVLRQPALIGVLRGCGVMLVLQPAGLVHRSLLARELSFQALARIEVLAAVVAATAAVGLALAGAGVGALVARIAVAAGVTAALAWQAHPWRPFRPWGARCWDGAGLRALVPFGVGVTGTELLNQVAQNVDFFLIGRYLGAGALGEYALAYSLATLPQGRLAPVLTRVMFPIFSHTREDDAALRGGYQRLVARVAMVSFPLLTAFGLLGPALLPAVYGTRWRGAAAPLPALCVAGAFYAVATTVGSLYRARGRPDLELKTTAVRALLLAGAVAVGLIGGRTTQAVALAVALFAASSTLAFQPVANRLIGLRMRDYLAALAPAAIGAAGMAAATWALGPPAARVPGLWALRPATQSPVSSAHSCAAALLAGLVVYAALYRLAAAGWWTGMRRLPGRAAEPLPITTVQR